MALTIPLATGASIPLPAGFKFNPTDEDIVVRYLHCRAVNQPLPSSFITDNDILDHNPWELVPEGASERYFFHRRVVRWVTGTRWKRAAKDGFWKASGKEVPVFYRCPRSRFPLMVGSKRTLVFYLGKPPAGQRTDWVMQEYRLAGAGLGPYLAMRPGMNNDIGQSSRNTDEVGKKHDDPADMRRGTAPRVENTCILLYPDKSWVVCRIHKKRARATSIVDKSRNRNTPEKEKIRFFDFLGQGNIDRSTASTSHVVGDMEMETSEVAGDGSSSEKVGVGHGK